MMCFSTAHQSAYSEILHRREVSDLTDETDENMMSGCSHFYKCSLFVVVAVCFEIKDISSSVLFFLTPLSSLTCLIINGPC